MDPNTIGIQDVLEVQAGDSFSVRIVLNTDGLAVNSFEFDIHPGGIGGLSATATGIQVMQVFGASDTFGFPNTEIDEQTLDNGSGEAAGAATNGVFGTEANGSQLTLAALDYEALTAELLDFDLNDVRLFDALGALMLADIQDGQLTVTAASSAPVPATALLMGLGLIGLRWTGHRSLRTAER